jgi:hypothetical protein
MPDGIQVGSLGDLKRFSGELKDGPRGGLAVLPVRAIGITRSADHDRSSERDAA